MHQSQHVVQPFKLLHVGPGGITCICCFPSPSSKARRKQFKHAKERFKRECKRLIKEELLEEKLQQEEDLRKEKEYYDSYATLSDYDFEQEDAFYRSFDDV